MFAGLLGIGGGWIIIPVLNILGLPIPTAVGTGLVLMFFTSVISVFKHRQHGNLNIKLGISLALPIICGVQLGKSLMFYLEKQGHAELIIRICYIVLLSVIGILMLYKSLTNDSSDSSQEKKSPILEQNSWHSWLRIIPIGVLTGSLSGLLGIGGGFLLVPAMIYILYLPTLTVVATSLFCIMFASTYGGFLYIINDKVEYSLILYILIGTVFGSHLGVKMSQLIKDKQLKLLFSCLVLLSCLAVILKQFEYSLASQWLILGSAGAFCLFIIIYFFNISTQRNLSSVKLKIKA